LAPALSLVVALALALGAGPRAQLEALQARRASEQAAARALSAREGSLLEAIEASESALVGAADTAREAEAQRAASEGRLLRARSEEAQAQAKLDALQGELGPRLRARARMGGLSELRILAASASLGDLVKRHYLWSRVVERDLALLGEARRALDARESARAARETEALRIASLARDAAVSHDLAVARREEHHTLLQAIRGARSLHERAAGEAAARATKLAEFVEALPPAAPGALRHTGFAALRGRLPRPVAGEVEVGFGRVVNPRFNTVTVQKGLDLRAPAGAEVRAIAPGRVAHAGWFRGYGNLVIVDHGDGFHSLVAHLASMSTAMGEEVEVGTLLGTVGDSASLKGPYLYFELRERGRPVDPGAWLRP
jgi:murein DD-endopeptidase MepM/ murein hydrolase activator NlpD